jgi:hypothetical protein
MNPAARQAGQASHVGQPGYARQGPALAKPKDRGARDHPASWPGSCGEHAVPGHDGTVTRGHVNGDKARCAKSDRND